MFGEYYCEETDEKITYRKKHGEDWPKEIEKDGKVYKRWYGVNRVYYVSEGKYGNAANGYQTNGGVVSPGPFTPLNKYYGKFGRTSGVETEYND